MKLFESFLTEKKMKGDTSPVKITPQLVIAETVAQAKEKIATHWPDFKASRPNMIFDFNPK